MVFQGEALRQHSRGSLASRAGESMALFSLKSGLMISSVIQPLGKLRGVFVLIPYVRMNREEVSHRMPACAAKL